MKKEQMVEKGSQEYYERQVAMGRSTLLVVLCLTAANLLLLISNTNFYLLFSASVPYYLTSLARGFDLAEFGGVNHAYTWMAFGSERPDFGVVPCLLAAEPEDTPMAYCGAGAVCGGYGLPGSAVPVHLRRLYGQHPGSGDARLGDL